MKDQKPEEKQFGLKPIEIQMLNVFQQQYNNTLSNFLSFIAMERLAYQVTERTQFRVEGNTLYISEAAEPQEAGQEGIVPSDGNSTKDALK